MSDESAQENGSSSSPGRREQAVALQYCELDELPRIVATGAGEIARQILALAREHKIPIQEDGTLTEMLSSLNVGAYISPESYRLVAEIISFLYHADGEFKKSHPELAGVMKQPEKE